MIIKTRAKNGQPVQVIKTFDELTAEEKDKLTAVEKANLNLDTAKDWKNFHLIYDKHGNLKSIQGYELSDEYFNKPKDDGIDIVDSMQLLFGKKRSHNYKAAKKRVGASNAEISAARRAINLHKA